MEHIIDRERLSSANTAVVFLIVGIVLAAVRWLLLLFPLTNLCEAAVYAITGYFLGAHCCEGKWKWGLYLAAPAVVMILYSLLITGVANSDSVVRNIVSLLLIPVSACLGVWLKNKNKPPNK